MQALFMTKDGLVMKDIPIPKPNDDELLVRMTGVGICSSDVSYYKITASKPEYMASVVDFQVGHEGSGVVVEVGTNVVGFKVGDSVSCNGGSIAEYFIVSASNACVVPDTVNSWDVIGEPVACCVYSANHFGILPGQRAAVVGCGFMGQICLQLLRDMGAVDILAIDPIKERRDLALRYGAARAVAPDEIDASDDTAYDVVVEAVGNESAITLSGQLVKLHGIISLVGYHVSNFGRRTVDMSLWNYKAITVSNGHVRDDRAKLEALARSVKLYAAGRLDTRETVTYYKLSDAPAAFMDMVNSKDGLIKACVVSDEVWEIENKNNK